MSDGKDGWYVSRGGQTFGPVTFSEVIEAAKAGRLEPRTDMLFGGDLADWVPAGEVDGVFEKASPTEGGAPVMGPEGKVDPGALAETADFEEEEESESTKLDLPGAHRLGYIFGVTVLPLVLIIGLSKVMPMLIAVAGPEFGGYVPYLFLLIPLLVLIITMKRFQNLAMSGWWWLGLGVPILQIWLYYRLFVCPPGYGFTKKLDLAGKVLAVIFWLTLVGSMVGLFLFGAVLSKRAQDEDFQEQIQEWRNKVESWDFQAKEQKDKAERE